MPIRRLLAIAIACVIAGGGSTAAYAGRRPLTRAEAYAIGPIGEIDLEVWNDLVEAPDGNPKKVDLVPMVELACAVTGHLRLHLDYVLDQVAQPFRTGDGASGTLRFIGWRAGARYQIARAGALPVDVGLEVELLRPLDLTAPFAVRERLILEKDLGRFGVVANLSGTEHLLRGDLGRHLEVDLGARYSIRSTVDVGLEAWGELWEARGKSDTAVHIGPSISGALGRVWVVAGAGTSVGRARYGLFVRAVLGVRL